MEIDSGSLLHPKIQIFYHANLALCKGEDGAKYIESNYSYDWTKIGKLLSNKTSGSL